MKKLLLLGAMVSITVCAICQTKLQVTVTNIKGHKGDIIVGVFDKENFLKTPIEGRTAKPIGDSITVVFENLKPGRYAVSVVHDTNNNKDLDKNKLGIPKEGFGFSNNVLGTMGPPSFERALIDLTAEPKELDIGIQMKYM